jgi:hypothetical protein
MIKTINEREIMNIAKQAKVKKKREKRKKKPLFSSRFFTILGESYFPAFPPSSYQSANFGLRCFHRRGGGKKRGENGRKKTL